MWHLALFSAYHAACQGCSGIMYSGQPANYQEHYVAADLRYWDIGDQIQIKFPDHTITYTVADTGSNIKGKWRFDILVQNHQEAINWGLQTLYVQELP